MARKINAEWHEANRMPKNPTHEQRMRWHFEHNKHCQCYPMSAKIQAELAAWEAEHVPQQPVAAIPR